MLLIQKTNIFLWFQLIEILCVIFKRNSKDHVVMLWIWYSDNNHGITIACCEFTSASCLIFTNAFFPRYILFFSINFCCFCLNALHSIQFFCVVVFEELYAFDGCVGINTRWVYFFKGKIEKYTIFTENMLAFAFQDWRCINFKSFHQRRNYLKMDYCYWPCHHLAGCRRKLKTSQTFKTYMMRSNCKQFTSIENITWASIEFFW